MNLVRDSVCIRGRSQYTGGHNLGRAYVYSTPSESLSAFGIDSSLAEGYLHRTTAYVVGCTPTHDPTAQERGPAVG